MAKVMAASQTVVKSATEAPAPKSTSMLDAREKEEKRMQGKFERASFVRLGEMRLRYEKGGMQGEDGQEMTVVGTEWVAKRKIVDPCDTVDFLILLRRLCIAYAGFHPEQKGPMDSYFDGLLDKSKRRRMSLPLLKEYDMRIRYANSGGFGWTKWDEELYTTVKEEIGARPTPFMKPTPVTPWAPGGTPQGGNQKKRRSPAQGAAGPERGIIGLLAKRDAQGNRIPSSPAERIRSGACRSWLSNRCNVGDLCVFAHSCVHAKCVKSGSMNHKPDKCPNK
jgi:hypothetical protein